MKSIVCLLHGGDPKPGDPRPQGYSRWYEWAEVQHKAGLRQVQCGRCSKFYYPQELSAIVDESRPWDRTGKVYVFRSPVCQGCESRKAGGDHG